MGSEGLSGKNANLTHVSGVLENEHVVGVQGPVLFTLHKHVLGNENYGDVSMVRTFNEQILDKRCGDLSRTWLL